MKSVPRSLDARPPQLLIVIELEELPRLQIVADTFEDQQRIICWLAQSSTRRRLADALLDALEEAA